METKQIQAKKIKKGMVISLPNVIALINLVENISDKSIKIHFGNDSKVFYQHDAVNILS